MNKFKVSVSDWTLSFSDMEDVFLKAVIKETVEIHAGGLTKINLKNATFDESLIESFKEGAVISNVHQEFELRNSFAEVCDSIQYDYPNMKIRKIKVTSTNDGVAIVDINLETQ